MSSSEQHRNIGADYLEQFSASPYREPHPRAYQRVEGRSTLQGSWRPA